jgi:hypothetical protein
MLIKNKKAGFKNNYLNSAKTELPMPGIFIPLRIGNFAG